jgi:hypothetical protein
VRLKSRRPTTMSAIQLGLGVPKSRCRLSRNRRLIRNRRLSHGVGVNRPSGDSESESPAGRLGDSLGASAGVDSSDSDSDSRSEAGGVPPVSRESGGIERPAERGRPPPRDSRKETASGPARGAGGPSLLELCGISAPAAPQRRAGRWLVHRASWHGAS